MNADGRFKLVRAQVLKTGHLKRVASGQIAGVIIPSILKASNCETITSALRTLPTGLYDVDRVHPPIARFGPALNDHRTEDGVDPMYWSLAESARTAWLNAGLSSGPLTAALAALHSSWHQRTEIATISDRPAYAGVIREINAGTLIHNDCIIREFPFGILDTQISAQLALNIYLSVGVDGGATTVWHRRWQPEDESSRIGYGHTQTVVADAPYASFNPEVGDALLFSSEHYHDVSPVSSGRRISLAFFLGLTSDDRLVVWS
ncbi:2OG-Fe(II)-dependent halogenase WelO5 family protein [Herbidospora mongoliensis]|uniref:2OG-Fe(II)-dependent halogenase WelO5 family protein n=1 Tax=Herbidospora mongoliensis TaxID=688067 RepID=UPI001471DEA4|nr:2OG-Fe(II) oxygenase [Herbidospora mongoliensis]